MLLHKLARQLESSARFIASYQRCNHRAASRRSLIGKFQFDSSYYPSTEDREQLRRQLDKFLNMPEATHDNFGSAKDLSHLPTINLGHTTMTTGYIDAASPAPKNQAIEVVTKTFVNGIDIATMGGSEIYELIAAQEKIIDQLDKIRNKPKKLIQEIEKRADGIATLVLFLDSQT